MAHTRQTNFSGGELAPAMHGRSDVEVWSRGLRTCRNFFPSRHGPAFSRPGTTYMRATKAGGDERIRLVPFVYSDTLSYVLELGHHYIRFHTYGQTLESSPGVPLEVTTPYNHVDLPELQWAQVGAVLHLTHQGYPPLTLTRDTAGNWTLADIELYKAVPKFQLLPNPDPGNTPRVVAHVSSSGFLYTPQGFATDEPVVLADHPARPWKWKATTVYEDTNTGLVFESLSVDVDSYYDGITYAASGTAMAGKKIHLDPAVPVLVRIPQLSPVVPSTVPANYRVTGYMYYRGLGNVFGFVGSCDTVDFVDDGREPDYALQPPTGENPFELTGGKEDNPAAVTFFEDRRIFGGTVERPGRVFASASGQYHNYDKRIIPSPGQALELELLTLKRERIRAMTTARDAVIIGTDTGMWALAGSGSPLDYDSVFVKVQDQVGCQSLPLLNVDNAVLWVRNKGRGVRALLPDQNNGSRGLDISLQSQHLFVGGEVPATGQASDPLSAGHTRQIVDWCYAEDPWGLVWAVRDDGVLLSLTFVPGQTAAWARHDFQATDDSRADGFVHAICSVPEGSEDAVYLVIQRDRGGSEGTYFLERMNSRVRNDSPEDDAAVDCCLRYQGAPQLVITGLSHLEGRQVWAVAVGNEPQGPLRVTGGQVTLPRLPDTNTYNPLFGGGVGQAEVVMFVGLRFVPELETLDAGASAELRVKQKKVVSIGFEVEQSRGLMVGQDFATLKEWQQRTVGTGYSATSAQTAVVKMSTLGTYDFFARAALRQTKPLPVCVLGLVREIDVGG